MYLSRLGLFRNSEHYFVQDQTKCVPVLVIQLFTGQLEKLSYEYVQVDVLLYFLFIGDI